MPHYVVRSIAEVHFHVDAEDPRRAIEKWWEKLLEPDPDEPDKRHSRMLVEEFEDGSSVEFFVETAWPGHYTEEPETLVVTDAEQQVLLTYTNTKGQEDGTDDWPQSLF